MPRGPHSLRALAATAALMLLGAAAAATTGAPAGTTTPGHPAPKPKTAAKPATTAKPAAKGTGAAKSPLQQAGDARAFEELGAYAQARDVLRAVRGRAAPDADLELALALDEARSGQLDSAAARLWGPLMSKALADTVPRARRVAYPWVREGLWVNGRYDGWNWYIARARVEVAAALGRWEAARQAAQRAVELHGRSGKERLMLAIAAGRAGDPAACEQAAREAAWLDPTLPEAHYLVGLFEWRAGRRMAAQQAFRTAVALDSSYSPAAFALVRSRLPGTAIDTLPSGFLTGVRGMALLVSPERPKREEFMQMDTPASIVRQEILPLPDSLKGKFSKLDLYLPIVVDEKGRAVLNEIPWSTEESLPDPLLRIILESLLNWRFNPALKNGQPRRAWATVQVGYQP
jgi:tetratricopeptide (TPR) repeat protein